MTQARIDIPQQELAELCRRWRIRELSLFGSVLGPDFGPASDVDILVEFDPQAPWSLFDLVDLTEALQDLFGRHVDLVEKRALRNPFRRHAILTTCEVVYAA